MLDKAGDGVERLQLDVNCRMHSEPANSIVVVGGGLAGLVSALLTAERGTGGPVYLVERTTELGGLLRSYDAGPFGRFDHGMHTFTSSGIADLDTFMRDLMPEDEWIVMAGRYRDISGVVFGGRLQLDTHYPDLHSLSKSEFQECAADLLVALGRPAAKDQASLGAFLHNRFGDGITRAIFGPIVQKLYGVETSLLDPIVAQIMPLDRVTLYEMAGFQDLMKSERIRTTIAFPDQRDLPLNFASTRYSLYPKRFGAFRLPAALEGRLRDADVRIMTNTAVAAVEHEGAKICRVELDSDGKRLTLPHPRQIFWTAGYPALGRLLGLQSANTKFEQNRIPAVMNLLLDRPLEVRDLYYFWCWEPALRTYRITNYVNYCPDAPRAGGFPVCLECALRPGDATDGDALQSLAARELSACGVFPKNARVLHSVGGVLPVGFPTFSLRNKALLRAVKNELASLELSNLSVTGLMADWGIVYQPEVLAHAYATVNAYLDRRR
jgi:protoporphyrinogen oxidase